MYGAASRPRGRREEGHLHPEGAIVTFTGSSRAAGPVEGPACETPCGSKGWIPQTTDFMPTYEYRCPKGHEFELFQRMSDEPKATCPECGTEAERLLSAGAGFLFKGEGFYITDYRSESYKKAARAEKGEGGEKKPAKSEKSGAEGAAPSGGSGSPAASSKPASDEPKPKPKPSQSPD